MQPEVRRAGGCQRPWPFPPLSGRCRPRPCPSVRRRSDADRRSCSPTMSCLWTATPSCHRRHSRDELFRRHPQEQPPGVHTARLPGNELSWLFGALAHDAADLPRMGRGGFPVGDDQVGIDELLADQHSRAGLKLITLHWLSGRRGLLEGSGGTWLDVAETGCPGGRTRRRTAPRSCSARGAGRTEGADLATGYGRVSYRGVRRRYACRWNGAPRWPRRLNKLGASAADRTM